MEEVFECAHNCDMCWPTIGRKHICVGILLWSMALCLIYFFLLKEVGLISFIVLLVACFLCRAYFCSANLTTFFFPTIPLLWGRLVLTAIFTMIPALDVHFLLTGPKKAIVHEFFINEDPDVTEEVAYALRNRYFIKILGEKELIIYVDAPLKVVFFENKISIKNEEEDEKCITYCFYDTPKDIANRIDRLLKTSNKTERI